jgi:hypothetical protein
LLAVLEIVWLITRPIGGQELLLIGALLVAMSQLSGHWAALDTAGRSAVVFSGVTRNSLVKLALLVALVRLGPCLTHWCAWHNDARPAGVGRPAHFRV